MHVFYYLTVTVTSNNSSSRYMAAKRRRHTSQQDDRAGRPFMVDTDTNNNNDKENDAEEVEENEEGQPRRKKYKASQWLCNVTECLKLFFRSTLQRSRDVGDKWDESDESEVLPSSAKYEWRRWPPRAPDYTKQFAPRVGHAPGNTQPARQRLLEVWADTWSPILERLSDFTNEIGVTNNAASWVPVDVLDMLKFHAALLRMSMVRRNKLKDYFEKEDGDQFIAKLGFRERFFNICSNLLLFSPKEADREGHSNRCDKENYDSLFSIRPIWEQSFRQFQMARNPPELLIFDEAMCKYTVRMVTNVHAVVLDDVVCNASRRSPIHVQFRCRGGVQWRRTFLQSQIRKA